MQDGDLEVMARGAEAEVGEAWEGFVVEVEDQTVCECVEPTATAAEGVVEMEAFDFGKAAEWARKVAQKLEKNGRLLLMAGTIGPSGHFCSRMRVEEVDGGRR